MTPKEQFIEAANIMCGFTREDLSPRGRAAIGQQFSFGPPGEGVDYATIWM
jgi:hypothetical protein